MYGSIFRESSRIDRVRRVLFKKPTRSKAFERFWSRLVAFSSRFVNVNENVDVTSGYTMHACTCSSLFLLFLGQTLHAHDHSYYYLFWLRVEVQKATLSLVTSLRLITHTHHPMREESASSFVHELHDVVHDALPLYVTPPLENSLVCSVSRWKTGSQRGRRFDRRNRPGATIWK